MSTAREDILGRVRAALRDVPAGEATAPAPYAAPPGTGDPVALFAERVCDYRATIAGDAAAAPDEHGARRVGVPAGPPEAWRVQGVELVVDDGLEPRALDALDGAVTGCAIAIAETARSSWTRATASAGVAR